ncbi:MAG: hypothetical protein IPP64_01350 [Bacteroidetes bacterium]|nr:hypothetical protein [Bacteroidota bacterium]
MLSIFLFNTVGYFLVFVAQKKQIKKEIRAQINSGYLNESLTAILTFSKLELNKVEFMDEGKEIRHNGKMYDIVKYTETETTISYYCIDDSKENSILSYLDNHVKSHVGGGKPVKDGKSNSMKDNVIKVYFSTENNFYFMQNETTVNFFPVETFCLSSKKKKDIHPRLNSVNII